MLALSLGAMSAQACQYCRLAATDPEAARLAAQMHSGGFPLDVTINQFQPAAPSATLAVPPAPATVATSAVDLPRVSHPVTMLRQAAAGPVKTSLIVPAVRLGPAAASGWADAGLLGLLVLGAWFCWRTRRVSAPVP